MTFVCNRLGWVVALRMPHTSKFCPQRLFSILPEKLSTDSVAPAEDRPKTSTDRQSDKTESSSSRYRPSSLNLLSMFEENAFDELGDNASFSAYLRRSKFTQLSDPLGRLVVGQVVHVHNDDLYIDFGGKLNCVCKRPSINSERYVIGAAVRLKLQDLELSTRFLGSDKDMTLLEADATLVGLYSKDNTRK